MNYYCFNKCIFSIACCLVIGGGWFSGFADIKPVTSESSSPTNVLTLNGAVGIALENNPSLRASGWRIDVATGRAYQTKLWTNPELSLTAEDMPAGGGGFSNAKKLAGISQTVPFPGKKKLDKQIGVSGIRLSETELNIQRLEVVRNVKIAFYRVLAAECLLDVAGELAKVAESSADTARKRVIAGAAANQEQLRADILLEQARSELSSFQRESATARQTLAMLLGRPDMNEVAVAGTLAEKPNRALLDFKPDQWLALHPSMVAAQTNISRAVLELRRARLEPYPDVTLGLSGGRESGRDGSGIVQFGLSLPLPIIDRSKGKKMEAQATVRIAEAEQAAVQQRILSDWHAACARFRAAMDQAANYREKILPKASEALRLVQAGFEQGKFGFIDLLDTQRTSAEARLAYQQKLFELSIAQTELESITKGSVQPLRAWDKILHSGSKL